MILDFDAVEIAFVQRDDAVVIAENSDLNIGLLATLFLGILGRVCGSTRQVTR